MIAKKDQAKNDSQAQINQQNLPSPDLDQFNLSIPFDTWGGVPLELIDQELDRVGITNQSSHLLLIRLFGLLDWNYTVRIGCHDY